MPFSSRKKTGLGTCSCLWFSFCFFVVVVLFVFDSISVDFFSALIVVFFILFFFPVSCFLRFPSYLADFS